MPFHCLFLFAGEGLNRTAMFHSSLRRVVEAFYCLINPTLFFHLQLLEIQMAANAPIVLNDSTTPTPVAHTFIGTSVDGDSATYTNRAETFVGGREVLTLRRKSSATVRRVYVDIKIPKIISEVLNGVTVKRVADFGQLKLEFIIPISWESDYTSKYIGLVSNAAVHAVVQALVKDDEFVW